MHILSQVGFCETCVSKEKKEWNLKGANPEGMSFFECLNNKFWQNQKAHSEQVSAHLQDEHKQDIYGELILGIDPTPPSPTIFSPQICDENVLENDQKIDDVFFQRLDDCQDNHVESSSQEKTADHRVVLFSSSCDQNSNLHHIKNSDDLETALSRLSEKESQTCFSLKEKETSKKKLSNSLDEKISLKTESLEEIKNEIDKMIILPSNEIQTSKTLSSSVVSERFDNTLSQIKTLLQKKRDVTVRFPIEHTLGVLEVRLRFQNKNVSAVFSSSSKKLMRLLGQRHADIEKIFESFSSPEIRFHNKGDL